MRDCGTCTWCCFFCAVPEYDSPVNQYCRHCIKDKGCSIYEKRKPVCRDFGCLWWLQAQVPENLRPDRCGIMFELPPNCKTYIGYTDPARPDIWKKKNNINLIHKILAADHAVVLYRGQNRGYYYFLPKNLTRAEMLVDIQNAQVANGIIGHGGTDLHD